MRWRLPAPAARPALAAFALVWIGVLLGRSGSWVAVPAIGCLLAIVPGWRKSLILGVSALLAGCLAGFLGFQRDLDLAVSGLPEGRGTVLVVASTDASPSRFGGLRFVARPTAIQVGRSGSGGEWVTWRGPPLLINVGTEGDLSPEIRMGHRFIVTGTFRSSPGRVRSIGFGGRISPDRIQRLEGESNPLFSAGNALRDRVIGQLRGRGPGAALVSGLLVGEVDELPEADVEALRSAGISHYVAVSGANVAGFLLLWFIVLGPLGVGARRRGVLGLAAIAVFAVATRGEPSVVRASLMAGLILAGRSVGIPVDSWTALGSSGALALLVAPDLTRSLGFQLSVLATVGIMAGGDLMPTSLPAWLRSSLGTTLAAQAAVTPLLLGAYGSVPLLSPLSNLVAAPLVAAVTLLGGIGTLAGFEPLGAIAVSLAEALLDLAHVAAGFPQVGVVGVDGIVIGLLAARGRRRRPLLALVTVVALLWGGLGGNVVDRPAVVFLDVGQGDASLILASDGSAVLVDAGPEPPVLASALRRYGVSRVRLLVITHPHEDHVAGLVGLVGRITIDWVWTSGRGHTGESWEAVAEQLALRGIPVNTPDVGTAVTFGDIRIEVLGPLRRYEGANDQSLVLNVMAGSTTVLMTGDIEVAAQADLGATTADILKVPHHGGATSNLFWLSAVEPRAAVISVGANLYGHPDSRVVEVLESLGTVVVRTDQAGDVIIPLTGDPLRLLPAVARGP